MEYYSAMKKHEIMPFSAIWMELEIIIPSEEVRQRQISYEMTNSGLIEMIHQNLQNRNRFKDFKTKGEMWRDNLGGRD